MTRDSILLKRSVLDRLAGMLDDGYVSNSQAIRGEWDVDSALGRAGPWARPRILTIQEVF